MGFFPVLGPVSSPLAMRLEKMASVFLPTKLEKTTGSTKDTKMNFRSFKVCPSISGLL